MVSYAGRLLADLGADVIVLERPGGEEARTVPPLVTSASGCRVSLDHEYRQQTKRSVSVDWTSTEALPFLRRIGASADAVLVTSRPGRRRRRLSPGPTLDWAGARRGGVRGHRIRSHRVPQRHWRATPFTAFAGSGLMSGDRAGRGPAFGHARVAHMFDLAGVRAAYLVQASLLTGRDRVGGVSIDLSVHEVASLARAHDRPVRFVGSNSRSPHKLRATARRGVAMPRRSG